MSNAHTTEQLTTYLDKLTQHWKKCTDEARTERLLDRITTVIKVLSKRNTIDEQ